MKKLIILTVCLGAAIFAKAQQPEMAKAIVRYKFSHIRDTTQRDKPYTENMVLFLGETSSAYKSFDRKTQEALMRQQLAQQMAEQKASGGRMDFKLTSRKPVTRTELYQFPTINKFVRKDNLITPYLIEETMPVIKWKITADTATIGTLHCQKATGHFKGRDYTAWFSPDLPFRVGPWKLNGLPGLIVEAYDTNKEVEFKFDGIEQVKPVDPKAVAAQESAAPASGPTTVIKFSSDDDNKNPNLIALPTNAVKTTEKEFTKLQEAMRKDPQAFMAAMGGNNVGNVVVSGRPTGGAGQINSVSVNMTGKPDAINNPIELPEKK
ncbi:GLPGLI family protein [Mucilaginibacter pallidiroseus]|uniref:GLPGLI family protein n=1 Tax=Mucilaginibacter pallidiroseus TaxID=2599295 RepID=A0A563U518_9SPHI|nr:GLPGLI family protein [Mucilaginibacter pallidiroseus]TWR26464.1 GLPGLI family protein [Mucilaginibacter pallidiroseus]